jgi:hypothetical protein
MRDWCRTNVIYTFLVTCSSDLPGQGGGAVQDNSRFASPHFSHGQEQVTTFGSCVFVYIVQGKILPFFNVYKIIYLPLHFQLFVVFIFSINFKLNL